MNATPRRRPAGENRDPGLDDVLPASDGWNRHQDGGKHERNDRDLVAQGSGTRPGAAHEHLNSD
ncbi:hypothetical protein GCM10010320_63000 [Streptomyces caelestis]|nr:hypothetical protein GCM10010320_63000 [Streptomyces caelestis]